MCVRLAASCRFLSLDPSKHLQLGCTLQFGIEQFQHLYGYAYLVSWTSGSSVLLARKKVLEPLVPRAAMHGTLLQACEALAAGEMGRRMKLNFGTGFCVEAVGSPTRQLEHRGRAAVFPRYLRLGRRPRI
jgi:hypothetical protein